MTIPDKKKNGKIVSKSTIPLNEKMNFNFASLGFKFG